MHADDEGAEDATPMEVDSVDDSSDIGSISSTDSDTEPVSAASSAVPSPLIHRTQRATRTPSSYHSQFEYEPERIEDAMVVGGVRTG